MLTSRPTNKLTNKPTNIPTNKPTTVPTLAPVPTYASPDDTSEFFCSNPFGSIDEIEFGDEIDCIVNSKFENAPTLVNRSIVGLFIVGGQKNADIIGCDQEISPSLNSYNDLASVY